MKAKKPTEIKPGQLLQLVGSHMIKKSVPDQFNVFLTTDHQFSMVLKEGGIVVVIREMTEINSLSPFPLSDATNKWNLFEVLVDGQYGMIREYKLLCGMYREVG
jgi:hypothetical protein